MVWVDLLLCMVSDFKGKKIVVIKVVGVYYLLIVMLEKVGLKFSDV